VHDAERDVQAAALAAGVGLYAAVGEAREIEQRQELVDAPPDVRLLAPVQPALQLQVLAAGGEIVGAAQLADVADAVPASIGRSVVSMRSVVVLPAPLGPRKPKISPRDTAKLTPRTASTVPRRDANCLRSSCASMTSCIAGPFLER
jgi:hypothetical protein